MNILKLLPSAVLFLSVTLAYGVFLSIYIVNPGFTAIQLRMGRIEKVVTESGFYFKAPMVDEIIQIDNRINKVPIETPAMSRDLQSVQIGMVINYRVKDAVKLYQEVGVDFKNIIIDPFTQESVKAVVAKFTAEDLIQFRHEAKEKVISELNARLSMQHISLIDFNFIHLDFSPDFIHAVEEKQIAEQSAKTAKNLTEKIKEEALQNRTRAEAEAYAFQLKKESVSGDLIHLKEVEAQLMAIEKWNGVLPHITGQTIPMIPLLNK